MYEIFRQSLLKLNHYIDVSGAYAGNARLFEATGAGTLLITNWKQNVHDMCEPGEEMICYRTPEECAEMVQFWNTMKKGN